MGLEVGSGNHSPKLAAIAIGDRVRVAEGEHAGRTGQVVALQETVRDFAGDAPGVVLTLWIDEDAGAVRVFGSEVGPAEGEG